MEKKSLVNEIRLNGSDFDIYELTGCGLDIQYMCMHSKNAEPTREELLAIEKENEVCGCTISNEELLKKDEWSQFNIEMDVQITPNYVRIVNWKGEEIVEDPEELIKKKEKEDRLDILCELKDLRELKEKLYEKKNAIYEKINYRLRNAKPIRKRLTKYEREISKIERIRTALKKKLDNKDTE